MDIEKKEYLVTGTPNKKTIEKIRLKLRQLLNGHKKCILGVAPVKDIPRLAYEFDGANYKHLFYLYKSTSVNKLTEIYEHFQFMYINELITEGFEDIQKMEPRSEEGPLLLYLLGKSRKRVF